MGTKFLIQSANPALLEKATRLAHEQIKQYMTDDIVGIVLLGAITRGYFAVEQLKRLPSNFQARIKETMMLHGVTVEELDRRKAAFMSLWEEMKPIAEAEMQLTFDEMVQLV